MTVTDVQLIQSSLVKKLQIQKALLDECCFESFVMTDWYTSQKLSALMGESEPEYLISFSVGCIKAGNDIHMPRCK